MGLFDAIGSVLGTDKTGQAMDAQGAAAAQSIATQQKMYDQTRADLSPYRDAGSSSLTQMQDPRFQKSFTTADFHQDPGYQFALDQGQQAIERSAAAKGMQMSGGTLKDLTTYGQGMANQQYQAAYDRYNNDQSTQFGRLNTVAGMGLNAATQTGNFGMNAANNISQTQMGLGNAQAAGYMAQGKQNAGMFNGLMSAGGIVGSGLMGGGGGDSGGGGGGGGAGLAGMAALFCDERLKTDIKAVSKEDLAELKSCIKAFKFRYKDEKHGLGDFIGPMAQDLEKCKLGKGLLTEDEQGNKRVDVHRTLMLILASWQEA